MVANPFGNVSGVLWIFVAWAAKNKDTRRVVPMSIYDIEKSSGIAQLPQPLFTTSGCD
jgi:hypothetical protein